MTLPTEELREEIYTYIIQEYDHLTHEEVTDMVDVIVMDMLWWMDDGNVEKIGKDTYIEQTTQWRKKFTAIELARFFLKEF